MAQYHYNYAKGALETFFPFMRGPTIIDTLSPLVKKSANSFCQKVASNQNTVFLMISVSCLSIGRLDFGNFLLFFVE